MSTGAIIGISCLVLGIMLLMTLFFIGAIPKIADKCYDSKGNELTIIRNN